MGSESGANDNHNQVMIYVRDVQGGEYQLLKNTELCATGMAGNWNYVSAPLTAFAGKKVQVLIRALVKSHALVCYDNVSVRSMAAHDLALASLAAPAAAMVGRDFKVTATVTNLGMLTSGEYTVELYKDGEKVAEQNGNELGSGASADYTFMLQMSPMTEEPVKLQAKVVYAQDTNQADNQSEEVSVEPKESNLPDAENLFGSVEDGIVKLSWDAPALDPVSEEIEESFESAAAFADNYEDWIFIDVDGEPVGGFNGLSVPGITAGQTASSFRVWDQSILGNGSYAAHSGNKYLFSLYRQDDGEVDDWAISPELDGSAQTITFYAKSYHTQFSEKLWIYTSKGSVNPDDFKIVRLVGGVVPSDWTEYTFTVPEGTKRFAIRCVSKGGFMLMVDDVKFTPKSNEPLELNGYNIWRDGSKLNSAVHESREFADSNVEPGNAYIYTVTSLFKGKGESAGSEPIDVFVETSSVNAPGAGLEVEKVGHTLVVRNPGLEEVRVVKADGITLHNSTGQAEIRIDVTPGVYFVKTRKVAKAVVIN
ncbi:MAG: choice-of-anchor J domain-containing protein, partial [Muribaculaceae bacterium]|nr:choice-of-anchor J domain-containing protein [Muribaculaceae bacterium]